MNPVTEWLRQCEMKRRERRVYSNLRRRGFSVRKTPWNHWSLANVGRAYRVYSGWNRSNIVLGGGFGGYGAVLLHRQGAGRGSHANI